MEDLGDRMKVYEGLWDNRLLPLAPVCARIDGRAFHTWTKGLEEPYDDNLRHAFIDVAKKMIEETGARVAHTFSDEINLVFVQEDWKSQLFFDGRHQKLCSVLASMVTGHFLQWLPVICNGRTGVRVPAFDARVWSVPDLGEAANYLYWRERDATRNSIQMLACSLYTQAELQGKSNDELQEMCFQKGHNWNDVSVMHRRGALVRKVLVSRKFTTDEIESLPEKHQARENPDLKVVRREIAMLDLKPLSKYTHEERIEYLLGDTLEIGVEG
jgi:tRNA(His) 5'-end guanylyltransferase